MLKQGIADHEGSYLMPRGLLPGHVPEVFASAPLAHALNKCLSELAHPNCKGVRDLFGHPPASGEPGTRRQSVEYARPRAG
jgi:hypothetical protein